MATHYAYEDPDKTQLRQGDVLKRTPELIKLLREYHPHYAANPDYQFFAVVTQSCDLVKRGKKPPKAPYIAIAAARTLEETLLREAAKGQSDWQREAKVIGDREKNNLLMFLQRVIDNNESGYFYLHNDQKLRIHTPCCVFLALTVTLRAQHYELLLDAKIAQLTDTFQAKLGWLIANMYGRVGTTEWDTENPDNPLKNVTKSIIDDTLHSVQDAQIKEGLAELKAEGKLEGMTPEEIFKHIREKNILPRSKNFERRALAVSEGVRLVNPIQRRVLNALHHNDSLKKAVLQLLVEANVDEDVRQKLADDLTQTVNIRVQQVMTDAGLPDRNEIIASFIRGILQDTQIAAILR